MHRQKILSCQSSIKTLVNSMLMLNIKWRLSDCSIVSHAVSFLCRLLYLLRSLPIETKDSPLRSTSTSTSAMAKGKEASTSASPTFLPTVKKRNFLLTHISSSSFCVQFHGFYQVSKKNSCISDVFLMKNDPTFFRYIERITACFISATVQHLWTITSIP